ncbi:MAG: type II toxin-antitoxin system HicB family antitoxin [Anaerolineales bacterium]|nr:type II toxin-antitoxin system HicB family antitoxin [Anaerolineales bacterium]
MKESGEIKTERFNIFLSSNLKDQLTTAAKRKGISRSAYVRSALEMAIQNEKETTLQKAVRELAPIYETDQELTSFTALDGEEFI